MTSPFAKLVEMGYAPLVVGKVVVGIPSTRDALEIECGSRVYVHAVPRIDWILMPQDGGGR